MNDIGFTLNPKLYDFLKYVALVILPAIAALILGLGVILNWGPSTVVAGIVTLFDTFLGTILGKSSTNFKKQEPNVFGDLVVKQDAYGVPTGLKIIGLQEDPILQDKTQVVLNVRRERDVQ